MRSHDLNRLRSTGSGLVLTHLPLWLSITKCPVRCESSSMGRKPGRRKPGTRKPGTPPKAPKAPDTQDNRRIPLKRKVRPSKTVGVALPSRSRCPVARPAPVPFRVHNATPTGDRSTLQVALRNSTVLDSLAASPQPSTASTASLIGSRSSACSISTSLIAAVMKAGILASAASR